MRVLINAISIVEGGSKIVLENMLEEMHRIDPEIVWYVAARRDMLSCLPKANNIIILPFSWANRSPIHHLYWYEVILPKLIKKNSIDICFSQTNFLPNRQLSCKSLLLIHHAG